ncbi:hypothetical protein AAES_109733 [Amazona aestiva]|uniref:Matrix-remodeling-associated protein 7 n=1 Tax=Amazona aestiva TaxID=12930 RepID=A0A0Q3PL62_AMAAE|nr:hypothetical protein AAES_109733 [Amazona aestiva]
MDMVMDLHLAVRLLFTVLALILASVFVKLWRDEGEQPREPPVAKPARESGPGDQEAGREWLLVEEVRAVEEKKEAAAEQQEKAAEEPSPTAESIPAAATCQTPGARAPGGYRRPRSTSQQGRGGRSGLRQRAAGGERTSKHISYTSPTDKCSSII